MSKMCLLYGGVHYTEVSTRAGSTLVLFYVVGIEHKKNENCLKRHAFGNQHHAFSAILLKTNTDL